MNENQSTQANTPVATPPVQPVPQPVPNPEPIKSNKPLLVFLIILVILSLSLSAYLAFQNNLLKQSINTQNNNEEVTSPSIIPTTNPPASSPTSDPTADWKTYTNTVIGVTFKYPPTWTYKVYDETRRSVSFSTGIPHLITTEGPNTYTMDVQLDTPSNFAQWSKNIDSGGHVTKSFGTETINGLIFEKYAVADMQLALDYVYKTSNGSIVRIDMWPYNNEVDFNQKVKPTFDQILSTFKFIQ